MIKFNQVLINKGVYMSMQNWAENRANNYAWCTGKGDWSILKNDEGDKELFYKEQSVYDLPSAHFELDVHEKGLLVSAKAGEKGNKISHYLLFSKETLENILNLSGNNIVTEYDEPIISFYEVIDNQKNEIAVFDLNTFTEVTIRKDGQMGFEF
jgi:hypothetical protein